jgi:riboflavin biosynthesis pyrimidine reductase
MTERPHVLVNMAMTADGKVDTAARRAAAPHGAAPDDEASPVAPMEGR